MTTQNVDPKTLDLIAKLHALATNKGATEAEAANALAKMQALLFRHNLSIADVDMSPKQRANSVTDEQVQSGDMIRAWFGSRIRANERQWTVNLAGSIARYNFASIMMAADFSAVWFVGTPENIAAVKEIWEFACEQVMSLADEAYKTYRRMGGSVYYRIWRRNFANGCVIRLSERLREEWNRLQQANVSSRALIVVNETSLTNYIKQRSTPGRPQRNGIRQSEGTGAGYSAGNRVVLGKRAKQIP